MNKEESISATCIKCGHRISYTEDGRPFPMEGNCPHPNKCEPIPDDWEEESVEKYTL